jgi:hypothetical protein
MTSAMSRLFVMNELVVVSRPVVVDRLFVVSGLVPRRAAKRPQQQAPRCA